MLVKVCGLTRYEDVEYCDYLGINLVGFIFYKKSPRCVYLDFVKDIKCKNSLKVGVFVDLCADEIVKILNKAKLDFVQLHGNYSIKDMIIIGKSQIIKVLWPDKYYNKNEFLFDVDKYKDKCKYLLIDAGKKGGGHGKVVANMDYLNGLAIKKDWFLAGGLGVKNIFDMVEKLKPTGIDLNSGVEVSPGIKDKEKIELIFNKIKELS